MSIPITNYMIIKGVILGVTLIPGPSILGCIKLIKGDNYEI